MDLEKSTRGILFFKYFEYLKILKLNASIEEYNSGKEKEKWRGSGKEQVGAG